MPESFEKLPEREGFVPSEATTVAWESRAHMLQEAASEPHSAQADAAHKAANEAFNNLVKLTDDFLFRSAMKRTQGDEEAVEKIIQTSYVRAYKGLIGFDADAKVETWLHSIMFNELSSYYKNEAKHLGRTASMHVLNDEGEVEHREFEAELDYMEPEVHVELRDLEERIINAIDQLHPTHRKVMHYLRNPSWTYKDLAEHLGTSENAAKVRVHRARKKLKEIFYKTEEPHEEAL